MLSVTGLVHRYAGAPGIGFPDFAAPQGGRLRIVGPSGSGKSTLLALLAGLLAVQQGSVLVGGADLAALGERARDAWRGAALGFVPQRLHLSDSLSVARNLALPYVAAGIAVDERRIGEVLAASASPRSRSAGRHAERGPGPARGDRTRAGATPGGDPGRRADREPRRRHRRRCAGAARRGGGRAERHARDRHHDRRVRRLARRGASCSLAAGARCSMTLAGLAWRYVWARPMVAALNLLMMGLGLAAIVFVTLVAEQLERQAGRDLAGIDLVVGAKGSPLQTDPGGRLPGRRAHRQHPARHRGAAARAPAGGECGAAVDGRRGEGISHRGHRAGLPRSVRRPARAGPALGEPLEAVLGAGSPSARRASGRVRRQHGLGKHGDVHGNRPLHRGRPLDPAAACSIGWCLPAPSRSGRCTETRRRTTTKTTRRSRRARGDDAAGGLPHRRWPR